MTTQTYFSRAMLLIVISLFLSTCLDEYNPPEISQSESILVVEGNISDSNTRIKLTQSTKLSEDRLVELTNARVLLENETGTFSENLVNNSDGFYTTETSLDTNDKYRIQIQTEGEVYASDYLEILPTPAIDSVSWESVDDAFQVQVTTHDNTNDLRYYLWTFEETWSYRARYPSLFIFRDDQIISRTEEEEFFICYSSKPSSAIQIGTTINLDENVVFKQPIHVIEPTESVKLSRKYSIIVKQYSISQEAYEFWQLLKKNSESLGTLFDPQPSQLPSNLTCISNPQKPVVGFVIASREQQERIFVKRKDLPFSRIPFFQGFSCKMDTIDLDLESLREEFESSRKLVTFEIIVDGAFIGWGSTTPSCADCRFGGGSTKEPDFWQDDQK